MSTPGEVRLQERTSALAELKGAGPQNAWTAVQYASLIDAAPEAVVVADSEARIVLFNSEAERMLGYTRAELIGRPLDLLLPSETVRHQDGSACGGLLNDAHVESGGAGLELQGRRRDGHTFPAHVALSRLHTEAGALVATAIRDITVQRAAEDARQRAEEERDRALAGLEEAQRIASVGSWSVEGSSGRAHWSAEMFRLVGVDPTHGPLSREALSALIVAEDRAVADSLFQHHPCELDLRLRAMDGVTRTLHVIGRPDPEKPENFTGTVQDVTEMRENERRLAHAQAIAKVGWWEWNDGGDRAHFSDELCRILGLEPGSAPDMSGLEEIVHPQDRETARGYFQSDPGRDPSECEFRIFHGDGTVRHVLARQYGQLDADGRLRRRLGTIQDITERAQQSAEEQALRRVAELVARAAGPAAVFEQVARDVRSLFDSYTGGIARFEESVGQAVFVNGIMRDGHSITGTTLELTGHNAPAIVFRTGVAARTVGAPSTGLDEHLREVVRGVTDAVAAPIVVAGRLWGCLAAAFDGRLGPADAEARLGRFADLVAMAIANAEAWQALAVRAATDAVTGLANHHTFQERLRAEVDRARRYKHPLSLVLLDLDHFKQINDTWGHQTGDRVLVEVAQRLSARARGEDLVARIGGEEFAWLMPETDRKSALVAAEGLRDAFSTSPFDGVGEVTFSAGVCSNAEAARADELVRCADRALYWAKDCGRNVSRVYSVPSRDDRLPRRAGQAGSPT